MPKIFLRSLLFVGLCAFTLGLAAPAKAIVILSNLPGTTSGGTELNFTIKAVGLTVGSNDLSFTSLTALFSNLTNDAQAVVGGIFADVGGNPGAQLVAFNPGSIAAGAGGVQETFTAVASFTLMANTSYWFVLRNQNVLGSVFWNSVASNPAPTPSVEVSYDGYVFSLDGVNWSGSGVFNGVQIEASRIAVLPEPGTLAVFGLGLLGLGVARRRVRAQV